MTKVHLLYSIKSSKIPQKVIYLFLYLLIKAMVMVFFFIIKEIRKIVLQTHQF